MALTKRELEEINEKLQMELRRVRRENERLIATLSKATERLQQVEEHYRKLRAWVIAHTTGD